MCESSAPSSWQLPVVGVAVAVGRLVLRLPTLVVQVGPAVWDIPSGRVRLVLPQQLRLDVRHRVLLILLTRPGRVREARRSWELLPVLLHLQVVGVTLS